MEQIIIKLGFSEKWVGLMMQWIMTVSYAIQINGRPQGHIVRSLGLRIGDPLSPYLFLKCAEGLSALLHQVVQNRKLKGISACKNGPKISSQQKTSLYFS